jgi:hypothetical protein
MFLRDTLGLHDVALNRAWLGFDSTLFLQFRTAVERLPALRSKRKLFSLPNNIFLDEDFTRSQFAKLKRSKEMVMVV